MLDHQESEMMGRFRLAVAIMFVGYLLIKSLMSHAELIDNGNCVYLKEALQSFQGRELTAKEMLVLKKLEEWWVRAGCDQVGNRPR